MAAENLVQEATEMKKKAVIMWIVFVLCVISTVVLRSLSDSTPVEYEEVKARVVSAEEKRVKNRSTGTTYTSYKVMVEYNGKECELKNVHGTAGYYKGKEVKAYLSRGSLYANTEGVQSSTPLFYAYFVFLIGSVVMLGVAANSTVKACQKKAA